MMRIKLMTTDENCGAYIRLPVAPRKGELLEFNEYVYHITSVMTRVSRVSSSELNLYEIELGLVRAQ